MNSSVCTVSTKPSGSEPLNPNQDRGHSASDRCWTTNGRKPYWNDCELDSHPVKERIEPWPLRPSLSLPQKGPNDSLIRECPEDVQRPSSKQYFLPKSPSFSSLGSLSSSSESVEVQVLHHKKSLISEKDPTARHQTFAINCTNDLLSPIKFTPQLSAEEPHLGGSEPAQNPAPTSPKYSDQLPRYIYYPPKNPYDQPRHVFDCHRQVPQRQLSYGEPMSKPRPRSFHRNTAGPELRRKAGWNPKDNECGSWMDGSLKASAVRPWYSEPTRAKPSLSLDPAEEGENIGEAVSLHELPS